jgi:hypothetical protein
MCSECEAAQFNFHLSQCSVHVYRLVSPFRSNNIRRLSLCERLCVLFESIFGNGIRLKCLIRDEGSVRVFPLILDLRAKSRSVAGCSSGPMYLLDRWVGRRPCLLVWTL